MLRCTLLIAAKGGRIADITVGDVLGAPRGRRSLEVRSPLSPGTVQGAPGDGRVRADVPGVEGAASQRAAQRGRARRSLPDRLPAGPRAVRLLPERAPAVGRLRDCRLALLRARAVLLGRPRSPPPGHRQLAVAARGGERLEGPPADQEDLPQTARRGCRCERRAPQLSGCSSHRAVLLSRPRRVGARRPGPLGAVGRTVPGRPARAEPAQVRPPAQGANGRENPRAPPAPAAARPRHRRVAQGRRRSTRCRPQRHAGRTLRRRRRGPRPLARGSGPASPATSGPRTPRAASSGCSTARRSTPFGPGR